MHKLIKELVKSGKVKLEKIDKIQMELDRARIIVKGMDACRKNIMFPIKTKNVQCYSNRTLKPGFEIWGTCTSSGVFSCYSNVSGDNLIGKCDLTDFESIFNAMDSIEFNNILRDFFNEQIAKAQ